jgi:hypothetical protein
MPQVCRIAPCRAPRKHQHFGMTNVIRSRSEVQRIAGPHDAGVGLSYFFGS